MREIIEREIDKIRRFRDECELEVEQYNYQIDLLTRILKEDSNALEVGEEEEEDNSPIHIEDVLNMSKAEVIRRYVGQFQSGAQFTISQLAKMIDDDYSEIQVASIHIASTLPSLLKSKVVKLIEKGRRGGLKGKTPKAAVYERV